MYNNGGLAKPEFLFPLSLRKNKENQNSKDTKLDSSASLRVIHYEFLQVKLLGRRVNNLTDSFFGREHKKLQRPT